MYEGQSDFPSPKIPRLKRCSTGLAAVLDHMRTWESDVNGFDSRGNVRFSSGLVLRMGTW